MRRYGWLSLFALVGLGCAACASSGVDCPALIREIGPPGPPLPPPPVVPPAVCPAIPSGGYPFRYLVLEGGGVKGIAYAGAFEALEQQGILDQLQGVAGTSAGAITAALVSLRYTPRQIRELLLHLDFAKFEDGGATGIFRLFSHYGWFRGDYFLSIMRCLVDNQTHKPHATFADLHDGHFVDLHVFATDLTHVSGENLTHRGTQEYSYENPATRDTEVALAVRESMSIPLFFASVRAGGNVFVDGGVLLNYPIDTFDPKDDPQHQTLGLLLDHTGTATPDNQIDNLVDYMKYLLEAVENEQAMDLEWDPPNLERTVIVNNLGIGTTDFQLTTAQMMGLVGQGYACTCSYLKSWGAGAHVPATPLASHQRTRVFELGNGVITCGAAFDPASRRPAPAVAAQGIRGRSN
ncbi:MAG TPA: patatin-like phospholipase family protein [Thermoanaerobaculia bacterium]|nr:patatin-like phospholipase family protein [Thermoanaerobaculia bacterium]